MDQTLTATRRTRRLPVSVGWPPQSGDLLIKTHEHPATVVHYLGYMTWDNGEVSKTGDRGVVVKRPYIEPSLSNTVRLLEKTLQESSCWVDVKFDNLSCVQRVRMKHLYVEGCKPEIPNYTYGQKVRWICDFDMSIEAPATKLLRSGDIGEVVAPSHFVGEVVVKFNNYPNHFTCPTEWLQDDEYNTKVEWLEDSLEHDPWLGPEDKQLQVGAQVQYLGHWEWYRGDLIPKDIIHTGDSGMVVKKPYVSSGRKYVVVRFENCKKVRPVRVFRLHLKGTEMPRMTKDFEYFDKIVRKSDGEEGIVVAPSPKPRCVVVKWYRLSNAVSVRDVEIEHVVEPEDSELPWSAPPEGLLNVGQAVFYLGYKEWTSRGRGSNKDVSRTGDKGYITVAPYTRKTGGRFCNVKFENCNYDHPVRLWKLYLPFPNSRSGPESGKPILPEGFHYGQRVERIDYGDLGTVIAPYKGGIPTEEPTRICYPPRYIAENGDMVGFSEKIVVKFDNLSQSLAVPIDQISIVGDDAMNIS